MLLFRAANGLTWNAFFVSFEALAIQRIYNDFSKKMCMYCRGWWWGRQANIASSRYNLPRRNVFFMYRVSAILIICREPVWLFFDEMIRIFTYMEEDAWTAILTTADYLQTKRLYDETEKNRPWIRIRLKSKCYQNTLSHFYPAWVFYCYRFILCAPQNILLLRFLWIFAYMMVFLIKIFLHSIHSKVISVIFN